MVLRPYRAAGVMAAALAGISFPVHAEPELANFVKGAAVYTMFHHSDSELSGPPGTTPPGIQAEPHDVWTVGFIYGRRLTENWNIELAAGLPPKVKVYGAGAGEAVGQIGTVKAYYPAIVLSYVFNDLSPHFKPYVGAGVNYTWFKAGAVSDAYTAAFHGTSTSSDLSSSWGGVLKLGAEVALDRRWYLDIVAQHYSIRTTAKITTETPGIGPITRTIDQKLDPNLFGLAIGYRF